MEAMEYNLINEYQNLLNEQNKNYLFYAKIKRLYEEMKEEHFNANNPSEFSDVSNMLQNKNNYLKNYADDIANDVKTLNSCTQIDKNFFDLYEAVEYFFLDRENKDLIDRLNGDMVDQFYNLKSKVDTARTLDEKVLNNKLYVSKPGKYEKKVESCFKFYRNHKKACVYIKNRDEFKKQACEIIQPRFENQFKKIEKVIVKYETGKKVSFKEMYKTDCLVNDLRLGYPVLAFPTGFLNKWYSIRDEFYGSSRYKKGVAGGKVRHMIFKIFFTLLCLASFGLVFLRYLYLSNIEIPSFLSFIKVDQLGFLFGMVCMIGSTTLKHLDNHINKKTICRNIKTHYSIFDFTSSLVVILMWAAIFFFAFNLVFVLHDDYMSFSLPF